jgi:hypothetical protein
VSGRSIRKRRLADRLALARRSRFIGRQAELDVLAAALAARKPPFSVLHVHGPGGVGKSTLLREFARLARAAGRPVVTVDGRDVDPSRQGLARALGRVPGRAVVLVDTYERLGSLDTWLRESLLPDWPDDVVAVLAGREPPAAAWRTDLSWAPLTRVLELGNFAAAESAAFLDSRGMPRAAQGPVVEFTGGHPLALSLVADVHADASASGFDPVRAPDVVRHLLGLFLEGVPHGWRREALHVCALARTTTEPLLRELLGAEEGAAAFQWLREQAFVESGEAGIFPHDLVRELLLADARWRDEPALRHLSRRVYSALHAQIAQARGSLRQRLQMDALYATRTRPSHAGFFDWHALDGVRVDAAADEDGAWMVELVRRHEGEASAALAAAWWRVQRPAFQVFRRADETRMGFLALLDLGAPQARTVRDPAVAAALAAVERHGPVRRGEGVVHLRWWMDADAYQAVSAAINLTAVHVVSHCLTRPGIAWNFVAMADPSFWADHFLGVNFPRLPEADFEVGGRRYGVFAHDWRVEPPPEWTMGAAIPMPFASAADAATGLVLGEDDFRRAVRRALRDYTRVEALADSPLRNTRLLRRAEGGPERALQDLLREAAHALRGSPRDMKLYRAVWHTYFEPAATQEAAAERLGLPFSTYRHHLGHAIDRIATWLWHRERTAARA